MKWLIIGIGGFLGAISRYYLSGWVQNYFLKETLFPIGTFSVNIFGSLLLGFFHTLLLEKNIDPSLRLFINMGFLGAFTTFSTFSLETMNLIEDKEYFYSMINIFMSCVMGLIGVWLGKSLYKMVWGGVA